MNPEKTMSDAMVEEEIARLKESEYVKLARAYDQIALRRRQYMYNLRSKDKRGRALAKQGFTLDNIEEMLCGGEEVEEE